MRAMLRRSAVLATAVTASLLSATSAIAGGAPDYGDVNVDMRAVLQDGALTIGGTYQCEGPGQRLGNASVEIFQRGDRVAVVVLEALTCDGADHRWEVRVAAENARPGRALAHGLLQVCEVPDGPCPGVLFDEDIVVTPRR
ncbi:DUF6299 family protein [Intrasporangium sp.]|uniref:DUF6299 family protein n=1 Tax=Intrasporangium sp. TaxID=1925024 RepID=UPI0033659FE0